MSKRKFHGVTVECTTGDIADQPEFDAVVNAANAELRPGGGVAGALHQQAGPGLEEVGRLLAPIQPGEAVVTHAYNLPNHYVVHCLGPVYGRDEPADTLLASCYRQALYCAERNAVESIAFPAISTGAFGYPLDTATKVAMVTILDELPRLKSVRHIRFVLFDEDAYDIHATMLQDVADNFLGNDGR